MRTIRIAARQSHLARYQALKVGEQLQKINSRLVIEYRFRESLGDLNLNDPLWKMPEKGVFTEDFLADLRSGVCDLVVHSWKDLPLGARPGTEIVATLPRADSRDLLLVSRKAWESYAASARQNAFVVLTSSPRRIHNLETLIPELLPGGAASVRFEPVRGNIPTRIKKLFSHSEAHGLIVAKAALDRLLGVSDSFGNDFQELRVELRQLFKSMLFMVLPLSVNPTAAAQGALAVEVAMEADQELRELLRKLNCAATFQAVEQERQILGSYGGGCHQKIGVSCLARDYGQVLSLRGQTDAGESLDQYTLSEDSSWSQVPKPFDKQKMFPLDLSEARFFDREPIVALERDSKGQDFWLARSEAWPRPWAPQPEDLVWTAGVKSWRQLAARGIWVHGCADGLGEQEDPALEDLLGRKPSWIKLSHEEGVQGSHPIRSTYRLSPRVDVPRERLREASHFYWMSGSAFRRALELEPSLREAWHFTGPGHTAQVVEQILGSRERLRIVLSHQAWLARWALED